MYCQLGTIDPFVYPQRSLIELRRADKTRFKSLIRLSQCNFFNEAANKLEIMRFFLERTMKMSG